MLALKCGHCGYTEAIASSADEVVEHPFEDYKEGPTGWGTALKRFDCQQCGARTSVETHITAFVCAFCGSNHVVPQSQTEALHKPESILPFAVNQRQCLEEFRRWVNGLWFRPNALKEQATPDKLQGVYMPFWPAWLSSNGLGPTEIGILLSITTWTRVIAAPLVAQAADRLGRRKPFMIGLAFMTLASFSLYTQASNFFSFAVISFLLVVPLLLWHGRYLALLSALPLIALLLLNFLDGEWSDLEWQKSEDGPPLVEDLPPSCRP
jgi:ribosomal protein S27AE